MGHGFLEKILMEINIHANRHLCLKMSVFCVGDSVFLQYFKVKVVQ